MTPNSIFTTLIFALATSAAPQALARKGSGDQAPTSHAEARTEAATNAANRLSSSTKVCRADEDTLRVLKLTTFHGGVRVDYEFVVSGRATWTHMNRPLLRQFGIRAAGTFCMPRDTLAGDDDYD